MQVRIPQLFEEIAANKPLGLQIDRGHNCYMANDNTRMIEHQSAVLGRFNFEIRRRRWLISARGSSLREPWVNQ